MTDHYLCQTTEIAEGQSRGFDLNTGIPVVLIKRDEQLFAYINKCPHLNIRLEWQEDQFLDPDGVLIECSTHGALFRINDGHCIVGPCEGQSLIPVPVIVTDDRISVLVG